MSNKLLVVFLVVGLILLGGCATVTEAGYYWGDYSKSLYKYTKAPSEQTLAEHKEELERIIAESNKRQLRVPPGIHAELGYIYARAGNDSLAKANYGSEIQLYPESRLFLERLTAPTTSK